MDLHGALTSRRDTESFRGLDAVTVEGHRDAVQFVQRKSLLGTIRLACPDVSSIQPRRGWSSTFVRILSLLIVRDGARIGAPR